MMDFNEYCEDILDLHVGLMSEEQMSEARKGYNKLTKARASLSQKAQDARAVAKLFGGKALAGTARQKEWAEKIRADKLQAMTEHQALLACRPNGLLIHSKFWIENRFRDGSDIGAFIQKQRELYKQFHEASDTEIRVKLAAEYNALTEEWGFK